MYVCLCNGFKCSDVKNAICNAGACSVSKVYKALDCRPNCGKCVSVIRDMICEQKGCLAESVANQDMDFEIGAAAAA